MAAAPALPARTGAGPGDGRLLVQPDPDLVKQVGLPPLAFRIPAAALEEVRDANGAPRLDILVDEHAKVLAGDRELRIREGPILALWANHVAGERGEAGDAAGAEHYCRLGLQFAPTNLSLQSRLGLALLQQGHLPQALVQFKQAMDDPRSGFSAALWLAAGRTAMELGLDAEAVRILEEMAIYLPRDDAFWDLLGEARRRAGKGPPRVRTAPGGTPPGPPSAAGWAPPEWEKVG